MISSKTILTSLRLRLPGGAITKALWKSVKYLLKFPQSRISKELFMMNLKEFFNFNTPYGPMNFNRMSVVPFMLYHVTNKENADLIKQTGIKSSKNGFVFLTSSCEYVAQMKLRLKTPTVICVNSKAMLDNGFEIFSQDERPYIYITTKIPQNYIMESKNHV